MSESESSALDVNSAASALAGMIDENGNIPINEGAEVPEEPEQEQEPADEPEEEAEQEEEEPKRFTINVDGKEVEVSESELAEAYKNGLRQSDYTKKTMEVAEQRKAAEAEIAKAQTERTEYATRLNQFQALLQAQLQEQSQTNWAQLIESDPVEYLKQQNLYQQRQASLYQVQQEQQQLYALQQQEQQQAYARFLQSEQSSLVDKIPAWKDEAKATAEKAEIKGFLKQFGFSDEEISSVADHRHVLIARQAMQMAKLLQQAPDAAKKVEKAPAKVERPGNSSATPTDGRTKAMQRLSKSGRIEDAAAVFRALL